MLSTYNINIHIAYLRLKMRICHYLTPSSPHITPHRITSTTHITQRTLTTSPPPKPLNQCGQHFHHIIKEHPLPSNRPAATTNHRKITLPSTDTRRHCRRQICLLIRHWLLVGTFPPSSVNICNHYTYVLISVNSG